MKISRDEAQRLGLEMVEILKAGHYVGPSGRTVDVAPQVQEAVAGTVSYPPEYSLPDSARRNRQMTVEVRNETTLAAVRRLISEGLEPAALNFASATSPGGGFLNGALAQEEYLARSSALWICLRDNPMYRLHHGKRDPFYTDSVIYSPSVPILRDDDGVLLDVPYACAIITCPAVHAKAVRKFVPEREVAIGTVMRKRILKVLAVAARHQQAALVLGAWGCGAFGNDGNQIALLFRETLENNFRGAFERVVFAITDWSEERRFIGPFERTFGGGLEKFGPAA